MVLAFADTSQTMATNLNTLHLEKQPSFTEGPWWEGPALAAGPPPGSAAWPSADGKLPIFAEGACGEGPALAAAASPRQGRMHANSGLARHPRWGAAVF